jgi:hypothetical protein
VNPGGLLLVTVIQLATFLAPLVLARAGFLSGEAAGLSAIVGWFVVGMPLSYAAADRMQRGRALPTSPTATRVKPVPATNSALYSR